MNGQEIAAATAFPNPAVMTAITSTSDTSASSEQEPTPIQTMQTCPTLVTRDDANAVPPLTPEQGSGYFFLPTRLLMPTTQPQTEEREVIEISDTDDEPCKKGPGRRKKRAASKPTAELRRSRRRTGEPNYAEVRQPYDLVSHDLAWLKMRYSGVGARVNDYARWLAQMARWANVNALGIQNAIKEGRGEVPLTELPEVRARRQGGAREL
ncbi:related to TSR3-protein required for processing of the 20S pre-rRNA [Ustilago bromivora]|uniref:Related to TSR3-protein required for processing of the 20S pre-rRNA n=1 Tax=Ustilago bromivora TaxID=307758 RepID=A0A1K0HBQ9_9BASI|nr:related to TSR3-protein required for processing of the 20S pre-rRNA [Ustilago bromivora]